MNTANIAVPDGWYTLVSTGYEAHGVPSPTSVVAASDFGVNVSAARPGQVSVTIEVAYRPPTDHVPKGWTLEASGTFVAATLLRVETPDGIVHDEFPDFAQIILPSEMTYRMFRRFRDDTGLEQHLFELTPAMILDAKGRPARFETTQHAQPDPDDVTRWEVACPTSTPGASVMINGVGTDRAEALRAVVDNGVSLLHRESPDAGPLSPVFVALGGEFAWVRGFGDSTLSKSDLAQLVLDGIAGERRSAVERAAAFSTRASRPPVKYSTQPSSVTEQWNRVADWFDANLPNYVISGADETRIADAQRRTGVEWPSELIELFRCVDGLPRTPWMAMFPKYELFGLDAMLDDREMMTDIWQTGDAENDPDRVISTTAGEAAWTFVDEFIPIAGMDGYFLFVDTRPGELNGCVTVFDKVNSDDAGPQWLSISALLDDLATSLETGTPFDGGWNHAVVDGRLEWDI
ncbi:SMI1/KNR4 family protein [Rhodococcus ruber]|uniref:SMI1/KNR4 family protein n=1 Tax=Rhodococcus ruber TaxID=1830 RepID=A0ABT4MAQ1_9NOCA|nr:SMI1/KNR4 family protein [Rhodococcus ruber]MCZ4518033.1 SMI1/KNR4 family protein [Rhodococcus ruber]